MRKILEYIYESKGSITTIMVSAELGIKEKEVEKVFMWLIENDKVIDLSSKQGMGIEKKRGVDYLSLLNNAKPILTSDTISNNTADTKRKMSVFEWIALILGIIVSIIVIYQFINGFRL